MTTPDPNENPYDPRYQPGPQNPSDQPGGNSEPTVPPAGSPSLPTWPQQPDGSTYPQYGYGQMPPYPDATNPGPQYPGQPYSGQPYPGQPPYSGQPYPGQQYPGQQPYSGQPYPGQQPYSGQQYPGQQYPGQPYPDPYPGGLYGAATPYGGQIMFAADPLVPHPGGGFNAWWTNLWSAFGRSWKQLVPIVLLTSALPSIILTVITVELASRSFTVVNNGETDDVTVHWGIFGAFVGLGTVLGIITLFAAAIGWSGGMWLVTRQGAGAPTSIGAALAFGARRSPRLAGILIVVGLMVIAGAVACVLPGLYLGVAASLVVPFAIFDRGTSAIAGSFRLVNRNFGAVLGRLVIMALLAGAASIVVNLIVSAISGGVAMTTDTTASGTVDNAPSVAAAVGEAIASAIVSVPTTMFLIIGILMTYAQMRARAVPTTAHDLVNGLGA